MPLRKMMKMTKQMTPMTAIKYKVLTICPSATYSGAVSMAVADQEVTGPCSNGASTASLQPPSYYTQPKVSTHTFHLVVQCDDAWCRHRRRRGWRCRHTRRVCRASHGLCVGWRAALVGVLHLALHQTKFMSSQRQPLMKCHAESDCRPLHACGFSIALHVIVPFLWHPTTRSDTGSYSAVRLILMNVSHHCSP